MINNKYYVKYITKNRYSDSSDNFKGKKSEWVRYFGCILKMINIISN